MFKRAARNLALALTLSALFAPIVHADEPPTPPPVTGTDPEPTSPNVIQIVLVFLHLA